MCGLHEIERKMILKQAFEKEKIELMIQELDGMYSNIQDLRERVGEFEAKYAELMNSQQYREKLRLLKEELGLAEVLPSRERVLPTIVEKLTGSGKFYNALAVEVLEVVGKKARENGGILTLAEVALAVNKARVDQFVQLGDIVKAVKILQDAELIPGIRSLPSGVQVVEFLPVEISEDSNTILDIASSTGWVSIEEVMLKTKWPRERAERALRSLESVGIARADVSYAKGNRWYFPSLMRSATEKK
jgi:hypothetical protein